jgi:hypothetical protein
VNEKSSVSMLERRIRAEVRVRRVDLHGRVLGAVLTSCTWGWDALATVIRSLVL